MTNKFGLKPEPKQNKSHSFSLIIDCFDLFCSFDESFPILNSTSNLSSKEVTNHQNISENS